MITAFSANQLRKKTPEEESHDACIRRHDRATTEPDIAINDLAPGVTNFASWLLSKSSSLLHLCNVLPDPPRLKRIVISDTTVRFQGGCRVTLRMRPALLMCSLRAICFQQCDTAQSKRLRVHWNTHSGHVHVEEGCGDGLATAKGDGSHRLHCVEGWILPQNNPPLTRPLLVFHEFTVRF